ncbi:putative sodium-dependent multivitamin transporter [Trichonephila clavipes]|nr:putative sodium-dependent multivitamin transporter [Trichonephila clavipes]
MSVPVDTSVDTHNARIWSLKNPHEVLESQRDSPKLNVFCAISRRKLLPYFITSTLNDFPGLPGLCICGIFSASLSTASSSINSLASVTSEDFLKPIFPSFNVTVFHSKIISFMFGVLCVGMSFLVASLGHLIKISTIILGLVNGPNLAVFLLAACTTEANEKVHILLKTS